MAVVVIDASVIIAFLNPHDAHHGAAIAALARKRTADLVLPATVYAEILVGPQRRGKAAVTKVEAFVGDFGMQVEPIDTDIARRAAILRSRHKGLKLPDALVLATGDILGASAVLTADTSWPKINKRAEVI
ncbi:MAG TPA: PIN domain-containing protein [Actinomycetota bacterium]|nr:PIN domain-containing protein [Actinomycetota bacterium]